MLQNEIASMVNDSDKVYNVAAKERYNKELSVEEREMAASIDAWAKTIGERGADPNHELAAFIIKTVEPIIYNYPDALLNDIFDRGSIAEFDDIHGLVNPKNTLVVNEAAKGGNVPKSYIDYKELVPTWSHKQVETELRYTDLRKNGFKTVSSLTMFAEEALKNALFREVFDAVDNLITSANTEQYIAATGSVLTESDVDALNLYILERGSNPFILCKSGYAQQIARMDGEYHFMSDSAKDQFNRYGLIEFHGGVRVRHIPSAIRVNDVPVLPDKKLFGFAGKIGTLDMRGSLRIYEDFDNNQERIHLKLTGFEFGYMFTRPEWIDKLVLV